MDECNSHEKERTIKLTQLQYGTLHAMVAGVRIHHMPYLGSFSDRKYWRDDNGKTVTRQIDRLIELGLVRSINPSGWRVLGAEPTAAGRKFIEERPND